LTYEGDGAQAPEEIETMNARHRMTALMGSAVAALAICGLQFAQAAPEATSYKMVWQDEFNGSTVATSKWDVQTAGGVPSCCLWDGKQQWSAANVTERNGQLSLLSTGSAKTGYTSGAVSTIGTYSFTFGRVDIRAKMPKGDGLWTGFWMLPVSGFSNGYAANELDIVEMLGQDTHTAYFTGHWNYGKQQMQCAGKALPDLSASFHIYSLIWTPTSVTWLLDGTQRCVMTQGVPQTAMYLIMNTYVGGSWPVAPNASMVFPQTTAIDYVRVSQAVVR
jgi:beta-glucanase (GH16 family)